MEKITSTGENENEKKIASPEKGKTYDLARARDRIDQRKEKLEEDLIKLTEYQNKLREITEYQNELRENWQKNEDEINRQYDNIENKPYRKVYTLLTVDYPNSIKVNEDKISSNTKNIEFLEKDCDILIQRKGNLSSKLEHKKKVDENLQEINKKLKILQELINRFVENNGQLKTKTFAGLKSVLKDLSETLQNASKEMGDDQKGSAEGGSRLHQGNYSQTLSHLIELVGRLEKISTFPPKTYQPETKDPSQILRDKQKEFRQRIDAFQFPDLPESSKDSLRLHMEPDDLRQESEVEFHHLVDGLKPLSINETVSTTACNSTGRDNTKEISELCEKLTKDKERLNELNNKKNDIKIEKMILVDYLKQLKNYIILEEI